jgi:hypothetical protein
MSHGLGSNEVDPPSGANHLNGQHLSSAFVKIYINASRKSRSSQKLKDKTKE